MSDWLSSHWLSIALAALAILGPLLVNYLKERKFTRMAAVLEALIQGVEDQGDKAVKEAINARAVDAGPKVQASLHSMVQEVTATMDPKPQPPT